MIPRERAIETLQSDRLVASDSERVRAELERFAEEAAAEGICVA